MNLYVMRHGTTVWNEKGICQGRSNNRLSKSGIALVNSAAEKLKDKIIDVIVVSPLMRTVQTANIINKYHGAKIIKDSQIIEIDQGIFTGKNKNKLSLKQKELLNSRAVSAKMETYEQCFARIKNFVENLKTKYNYNNVLVVTHNVCASFIEDIILKRRVDYLDTKFVRNFGNAQVKHYQI